jgi:hypothetical protein
MKNYKKLKLCVDFYKESYLDPQCSLNNKIKYLMSIITILIEKKITRNIRLIDRRKKKEVGEGKID